MSFTESPSAEQVHAQGLIHKRQGQLTEAVTCFRQALVLDPTVAQVHSDLGSVLGMQGQLPDAIGSFRQALALDPTQAAVLNNLGIALGLAGSVAEAIPCFEQAASLKPEWADPCHNLGLMLEKQGRFAEAISQFEQAIQRQPDWAEAYASLGLCQAKAGNLESAVNSLQHAASLNPNQADIHYNLAVAHQQLRRIPAAITSFQQALLLNPNYAEAHNNLGSLYQALNRLDESVAHFRQAIALRPHFAEPHANLALILQFRGNLNEAIDHFQQAVIHRPDWAETQLDLAMLLGHTERFEAAILQFRQVLALQPNLAGAYYGLANVLHAVGQQTEALAACEQGLQLNPGNPLLLLSRCMLALPILYRSSDEITAARTDYGSALATLIHSTLVEDPAIVAATAAVIGLKQPFYLPYQGQPDRELQEQYGDWVHRILAAQYPQWSQPLAMPPVQDRIRVGFVSGFFKAHSVWKIPLRGWIEQLDRTRFQLIGFHTSGDKDPVTVEARALLDVFEDNSPSFEHLCERIRSHDLHVLIFPEIGMDPVSAKVAALRLAPVQCTSLGHPETSGLPTIDYVLTSDRMEPQTADADYSEIVVRLPHLGIHYIPSDPNRAGISAGIDFAALGVKPDRIKYLCAQSLFKYLPQHDQIFPRIAAQVKQCQFLFIAGDKEGIRTQFAERLQVAFGRWQLDMNDYVVFLPKLNDRDYLAFNQQGDIFLDNPSWSGCNTTCEALAWNLPVVTLPGSVMRARHSAAILQQMGVTDTIATDLDHFVDLAVQLGQDPVWRQSISEQIAANRFRIERDPDPVRALEDFFSACVTSASIRQE